MCGIIGYAGNTDAPDILIDGLYRLEYRGYDSAGIAVREKLGKIVIEKTQGKISKLEEKLKKRPRLHGTVGIGHTRWATHGAPNEENAHPHVDMDKTVFGVHNGIIENYKDIKDGLLAEGYSFYSQTDTEVFINLIAREYKKEKEPIRAICNALQQVRGSYAMAVMFSDIDGVIYTARKDSPLIIGVKDGETFIASDVPAILPKTKNIYYLDNGDLAAVSKEGVCFYDKSGAVKDKEMTEIKWNAASAEKGRFDSFMLKEIYEVPLAIRRTVDGCICNGIPEFSQFGLEDGELAKFDSLLVIGCGSAYHVGVAAQYIIEELACVPVRVEYSSEFRYRSVPPHGNTLCIVISQSGETADTLFAMRDAKSKGMKILGIVNSVGSSIAREADAVLYTHAGPEIAVATTKAYSAQLSAIQALALRLAYIKRKISHELCRYYAEQLQMIPNKIESVLERKKEIEEIAKSIVNKQNAFLIGRGADHAVCLEGSLKIKEVSYMHSEAYPAGELKHGTISLIEPQTPVFAIITQHRLAEKVLSNMAEVKSRGADVIAVVSENTAVQCEKRIILPEILPYFAPSLAVVPFQLMGYYLGKMKGYDVDKPRNLAKSVTVE